MVPGGEGRSLSLLSSFPAPFGPWRLLRLQMKGTHVAGRARLCILFAICAPHPLTELAWCGHCGSIQPSESPAPHSEATPAFALTLLLSRLSCVLALGFGVSTSASLCLSLSLSLSVSLLPAAGSS